MDNIQKTFVLIKPDGVKRSLVGEITQRFERVGLKLIYARMIFATEEQAKGNYPGTDEWLVGMGEKTLRNYNGDLERVKQDMGSCETLEIGRKIYGELVRYITSGPMIAMVWEGNHAVAFVKKLVGATQPLEADIGSIRGDFGFDSPQLAVRSGRVAFENLIHRSDSEEEAEREIGYWLGDKFKPMRYLRTDHVGYGIVF